MRFSRARDLTSPQACQARHLTAGRRHDAHRREALARALQELPSKATPIARIEQRAGSYAGIAGQQVWLEPQWRRPP